MLREDISSVECGDEGPYLPFGARRHCRTGIRGGIVDTMHHPTSVCSSSFGFDFEIRAKPLSQPNLARVMQRTVGNQFRCLRPRNSTTTTSTSIRHSTFDTLFSQQHREDGPRQPPAHLQRHLARCRDAPRRAMPRRQQEPAGAHGALPVEDAAGRHQRDQHRQDMVCPSPCLQDDGCFY